MPRNEPTVVLGATGHVGAIVANRLLDAGRPVRVVGRDAARLETFARRGAETAVAAVDDRATLERAFSGARAVFALIPPNMGVRGFRAWQDGVAEKIGAALEAARVPAVVTLSSVGAHLPEGNGPIAGLYRLEQRVGRVPGIAALHLRPTFFMENLLTAIPMIRGMGMNGGALAADLPFPMIATRDIGEVAAARMLDIDFRGVQALELLGPRNYSMAEATTALGRAIGRPDLRYVQFPYDQALAGMVQMGLPEEMAALYVEMARGFNEGRVAPTQARSPQTTTPTTLEWFADNVFAPAFRAAD